MARESRAAKPRWSGQCWTEVREYVSSLAPQFRNCDKRARDGHLTCHWHRRHEEAAQRLKRRLDPQVAPHELTVEKLEAVAGPASDWEGSCYAIACRAAKLVNGQPRYGHWLGTVNPNGYWGPYAGAMFQRHGWVKLDDGRILDPTRWSFEAVEPYIWLGANDGTYDAAGQQLRRAFRRPPPGRDADDQWVTLCVGRDCALALNKLLQYPSVEARFNKHQLFWLANAPLDDLGVHAPEFYGALMDCGKIELVPIDHRIMTGLAEPPV